MKTKVKGKKADINRSLRKTGGGPPSDISMTTIDDDVAKLIGPTTIYGDASVDESIAEFNYENNEDTEIINVTDCKGKNTKISNSASRLNNVLKEKHDLIAKKSVQEQLSICEKENYPSISQKSVDRDNIVILESSNNEIDVNSKITLNNPNPNPIRRTAKVPREADRTHLNNVLPNKPVLITLSPIQNL
ncbi:PREDICTED: uncharacterized protein LOC105564582 isoform X2 [Vollenhovia emeryi]|uniref:uncharacterized protein LOC105564582 isoform X2 n=1 Tax=Vollenhovia emeryi TaxID=411798 RepID=UPI0005F511A1|nr:PREDICTED: uncharacterized protein LOC105564582 isoform X2 [Vollenhovia emeryi]